MQLEPSGRMAAPIVAPWTTREAARFLKIHERTLIRLAAKGEIPAFRIGKHWRFIPSEVQAWMRARSVSSTSELNPVRGN